MLLHDISEVKQTQIYDARLCTSNQEKNSQTKNKLPKQLVRSVGCRYGVQNQIYDARLCTTNHEKCSNHSSINYAQTKTSYPNSQCVVSATSTVRRGFCLTSLLTLNMNT